MATQVRQWSGLSTETEGLTWLQRGLIVVAGSAFIAICAHIALPLPWTPVPITFQPFAVILLGLLFGPAIGASAAVLYLIEGATGLPVFTPHGAPGIARLIGPTGGYLMSYPAAAALAGWLFRRTRARLTYFEALGDAVLASTPILICGACWMFVITHAAVTHILASAVLPFLPGDFLKCALAAGIALAWERRRARRAQ